jgi:hypothetical protein
VHHCTDTFESVERAFSWADPWNERVWEEPSDTDETALLISTRKKPGALGSSPVNQKTVSRSR